jgi:hypothetical protein
MATAAVTSAASSALSSASAALSSASQLLAGVPVSSGPSSSANPPSAPFELSTVEEAIAAVKNNEFVVVVDDLDRENEGDLIIPAVNITQQQMAWLIRHSSCVAFLSTTSRFARKRRTLMKARKQRLHLHLLAEGAIGRVGH